MGTTGSRAEGKDKDLKGIDKAAWYKGEIEEGASPYGKNNNE